MSEEHPTKRRNMELVRDILLAIESQPAGSIVQQISLPDTYSAGEVRDHLRLIDSAGLIEGEMHFSNASVMFAIHGLSSSGHDLLGNIRDATVWEKTRKEVGKVGGSVSIDVLKEVAKAMVLRALGME